MKTMTEILKTWEKIKSMALKAVGRDIDPDLSESDQLDIKERISDCIFSTGGEVSSRSRAVELGTAYLRLSTEGKHKFMNILAREFGVDHAVIDQCIETYQTTWDDEGRVKAEMGLYQALIPPRVKLLKRFNALPNGFKFLIDFRAELMPIRKRDPHLRKLESDLRRLLSSWFDIGLLDLEEITWNSPAALLEQLIKYEAVHEIRSWWDLKNRLHDDRLCFAFFHNKIPDEPLIFVEVALVDRMSDNIAVLLDENAETLPPEAVDTAIFYSISNAQEGLTGISLGNFLIKRVVDELTRKFTGLKHFATLSPLPNFNKWLFAALARDEPLLTPSETETLKSINPKKSSSMVLLELLNSNWSSVSDTAQHLKPILLRLCAYYLTEVKRGGKAFDPVANFHLTNGAHIERLNWLADLSPKGLDQSSGMMVNYYYKPSEIEKNHELYVTESKITISKDVKTWLKG
ncbi:MAG: malonyl-CoA decarboxylase [bacterium]|nr:malonyl-CoA decarboxylase [bacterium]